LHFGNVA